MSDRRPPAGWYDDPAGGGGRRYWNGSAWTQRAEKPAARPDDARLPDGYMMLNGVRVRLGTKALPATTTSGARPGRTALRLLVLAALAVVACVWLFSIIDGAVDSQSGSGAVESCATAGSTSSSPTCGTSD